MYKPRYQLGFQALVLNITSLALFLALLVLQRITILNCVTMFLAVRRRLALVLARARGRRHLTGFRTITPLVLLTHGDIGEVVTIVDPRNTIRGIE